MRLALIPLLLLPLTMRAQTGSTTLHGAAPDSLVCFTMAEAALIHDTVWSAVNHRRARVIMAAMIGNLERQLADQKLVSAAHEQRAKNAEAVVADAVTAKEEAERDVEFWRRKARRRFWWGFFFGTVTGGAAGYGASETLRP